MCSDSWRIRYHFPTSISWWLQLWFQLFKNLYVAPLDWFPHSQKVVELYQEHRRKTTILHDKLLVGAAMEAVKSNRELNFLKNHTADNLKWKNVYGDRILAKSLKIAMVDANNEPKKDAHTDRLPKGFAGFNFKFMCFLLLGIYALYANDLNGTRPRVTEITCLV